MFDRIRTAEAGLGPRSTSARQRHVHLALALGELDDEIAVRPGASTGSYATIPTRQELTTTAKALFAARVASATTVAGLSCASGQLPKWSASGWTCGADTDTNGGGTVTSVAPGTAIVGGPVTATGTLSVAAQGITSGLVANAAVTSSKLAAGAVGVAQVDTAQVQARLAANCPVGQYLRGIAANGTATCVSDADTNSGGTVTNVASGSGLAGGPITATGTLSIANGGVTRGKLAPGAVGASQIDTSQVQARVAAGCPGDARIQGFNADGSVICANAATQAGFTTTMLDGTANVGQYTSATIGADGLALIGYYDATNGDLKVAHCSNGACTSASLSTVDSAGNVGQNSSIAVGADGLALISYLDAGNANLKVAHCTSVACSSATTATIDASSYAGYGTSIAIGADGLGLIGYFENNNSDLKVAHCTDTSCSTATLTTVDSGGVVGANSAITIGTDGLGLISYQDSTNGRMKVAHCSEVTCATATAATVDGTTTVSAATSITVGADGLGLISYYDTTNGDLRVAHCSDIACSSATTTTLDAAGTVGQHGAITIGVDGLGLIGYYDTTNGDLKVAHCSNALCQSYVRRR